MEHLHHFGLSQDPFSNEPDLRFFIECDSHLDAQRRVERSLRQAKGLTLLTGDGGMGKTLLARRILDALEEEVFEAVLLVMLPGVADAVGILQRFARQLGVEEPASDRAGLLAQVYEHLAIVREDGRHAVLMIDDAQIMAPDVLSELGGLLNLEYEDRRLVSMLLMGSSELDRLVQADAGIAPRVEVRVRLQPLDQPSSRAYLEKRLSAVGGNLALIPDSAHETLYKFGRGRPRLLNTLADNALFEAYLGGRSSIDSSDVERAASDLGVGPDPGDTWVSPTTTTPHAITAPLAAAMPAEASFDDAVPHGVAETVAAAAPILDMLSMPDGDDGDLSLSGMDAFMEPPARAQEEPLLAEASPLAELELSMDMMEAETPVADPLGQPLAAAEAVPDFGVDLDSLEFGSEPIEFALEEAELSASDGEELEGVYVELIEE